jgi:hypothetical protein
LLNNWLGDLDLLDHRLGNLDLLNNWLWLDLSSLNLSFHCLVLNSWDGFLDWDVLSLSFIGHLWNVFCLVLDRVVVSDVLLLGHLDLDCFSFVLNNRSLVLDVLDSRFTLDWRLLHGLNDLLDDRLNRLHDRLNNWLDHLLDGHLCHSGSDHRLWHCVSWLVGWLVSWLVSWLVGCLVGNGSHSLRVSVGGQIGRTSETSISVRISPWAPVWDFSDRQT